MPLKVHPSLLEKNFSISSCYDSHVHYFATGELAFIPSLREIKTLQDFHNLSFPVERKKNNWIYGFGWDENKWNDRSWLHRNILDQRFPGEPVLLSRIDGHSSWCNTKALVQLGFVEENTMKLTDLGQKMNNQNMFIQVDNQGRPTGILKETPHILALQKMGDWSEVQKKSMFVQANQIFTAQGYTHVRDMTTTIDQYQHLRILEEQNSLQMNIDLNFVIESNEHFVQLLSEIKRISSQESLHLKVRGIKVFFDGSLGSNTALISGAYRNGTHGTALWSLEDIKSLMTLSFQNQLEFSVHTLGDEATEQVVRVAQQVSQEGNIGRLNLEHLEICRPETIQKMKPLHIRCHMQPAYWLSDKTWLQAELSSMQPNFFQWEALRAAKVDLQFGSDSPIEAPSVFNIQHGLYDSALNKIPAFRGDFKDFCISPYKDQVMGRSEFDQNQVTGVWLGKEKIFGR